MHALLLPTQPPKPNDLLLSRSTRGISSLQSPSFNTQVAGDLCLIVGLT
jgi:hypothetical protein